MISTAPAARHRRRFSVMSPFMVAALLLLATPLRVLAAPSLALTPSTVTRGQSVTMTGSGYHAGAVLRIVGIEDHRRKAVTTIQADAFGHIRFVFHVGPGADVGSGEFLALGQDGRELARARLIVTNAPPIGPRASISPTSAPVGTRLTLRGSRFPHHAALLFGVKTTTGPMLLGHTVTDARGTFTTRFSSSSLKPGKYELGIGTRPGSEPLAITYFTVTRAQR
jgi:hypothetical protein